jgi:hypothetical protein
MQGRQISQIRSFVRKTRTRMILELEKSDLDRNDDVDEDTDDINDAKGDVDLDFFGIFLWIRSGAQVKLQRQPSRLHKVNKLSQ